MRPAVNGGAARNRARARARVRHLSVLRVWGRRRERARDLDCAPRHAPAPQAAEPPLALRTRPLISKVLRVCVRHRRTHSSSASAGGTAGNVNGVKSEIYVNASAGPPLRPLKPPLLASLPVSRVLLLSFSSLSLLAIKPSFVCDPVTNHLGAPPATAKSSRPSPARHGVERGDRLPWPPRAAVGGGGAARRDLRRRVLAAARRAWRTQHPAAAAHARQGHLCARGAAALRRKWLARRLWGWGAHTAPPSRAAGAAASLASTPPGR